MAGELVAVNPDEYTFGVDAEFAIGEVFLEPFICDSGHTHSVEKVITFEIIDNIGDRHKFMVPVISSLGRGLLSGALSEECARLYREYDS